MPEESHNKVLRRPMQPGWYYLCPKKGHIHGSAEQEKMSTGVGKGFAIPHGKTNSVTEILAAFGKSKSPIDYNSLDGEPVHLIFLLIGKENLLAKHIKLLSRISRMMNNEEFRKKLVEADSKESILKLFEDEEHSYSDV